MPRGAQVKPLEGGHHDTAHTHARQRQVGESRDPPFFSAKNVTIPVAVSVFPEELYQPPRSWAEKAYPRLVHYNKLDRGGHFAAWEQPQLLVDELRPEFRSLR